MLTNPKTIRSLAAKYDFTFKKGLGQNFLIDESALSTIVQSAKIGKDTLVIEIGPGFGVLTQKLCAAAKKVIAIEIDKRILPILSQTLKDFHNVEIINEDILKTDLNSIIQGYSDVVVAANLPYYITTPIITDLLFKKLAIRTMVFTVQKEVAQRMTAKNATKDYGALTLAIEYFANARLSAVLPSESFFPPPKVESAVVVLDMLSSPKIFISDEEKFFKVVKAAFMQRRKTLKNALFNCGYFKIEKEELEDLIVKVAKKPDVRGEVLNFEQFAQISDRIF